MAKIALGSVGKIVSIALKIKEAAETVKQIEKECRNIQMCAARVSALLKQLHGMTETMEDDVMRGSLEDLAESLEGALELVTGCQEKRNIMCLLCTAGDLSKELTKVKDDISRKITMGLFATTVQTIILINIGGAPTPPPRPQPVLVQAPCIPCNDDASRFEVHGEKNNVAAGNESPSPPSTDVMGRPPCRLSMPPSDEETISLDLMGPPESLKPTSTSTPGDCSCVLRQILFASQRRLR